MYKIDRLMKDYTKEELAEKVIELDKRETELLISGRKAQDSFNRHIDELTGQYNRLRIAIGNLIKAIKE